MRPRVAREERGAAIALGALHVLATWPIASETRWAASAAAVAA